MGSENVFNPLDKKNLGKSVVEALLESDALPLAEVSAPRGAGIYAIYYRGEHPLYHRLSELNRLGSHYPIYVGKAVPKGGRKGAVTLESRESNALRTRLTDHKESIEATGTLDINDFSFRSLVVDDIWIPLGESLVIQKFQPLWNIVVEGFGNHDPGKGRYQGRRPLWDELHPGRTWATRCKPPKLTAPEIIASVETYMAGLPSADID